MSLGEHSLDQLARLRRLLQRFAAPDPGMRIITLDVEAHAAMLEPEFAVLDPAPFGGLGTVEMADATAADSAPHDRRTSRPSPTSSEAARRQRRQEMLEPSKLPQTVSKVPVPGAFKPTASHRPVVPTQQATTRLRNLNARAQNQAQRGEASKDGAVQQNKKTSVSTLSTVAPNNADKSIIALPVATSKLKSTAAQEQSENKVELNTLVERVLHKRRPARNNNAQQPSALATRTRLQDATAVQQRRLPPSLVLPVTQATPSASRINAVVVTQQGVRSNIAELVTTPNAVNKHENMERARTRAATQPTFFFNALEPREADESEESLTDRIDQVLREQARRQGVDLT